MLVVDKIFPSDFDFNQKMLDADKTLQIYEGLRPVLPKPRAVNTHIHERLIDLLDECDALILDGFGVINVGADKIDGIDTLLAEAKARNIIVVVLTNGASHPSAISAQKYQDWGLGLTAEQVVSSRDACVEHLKTLPASNKLITGCMATTPLGLAGELRLAPNSDNKAIWDIADGVVLLGTTSWTAEQQTQLEAFLKQPEKQLYIANPDISAPHLDGFSFEPGFFASAAMQKTATQPYWCGKPHAPAFEIAIQRVNILAGRAIDTQRMIMVGDSPHTDILGGNAAGLRTALITSYGLLREHRAEEVLKQIDIWPDFLVKRL